MATRPAAGGSSSSSPLPPSSSPFAAPEHPPSAAEDSSIAQKLWKLRVPLQITYPGRTGRPPLLVSVPRFSYLAQLLPRVSAYFFGPASSLRGRREGGGGEGGDDGGGGGSGGGGYASFHHEDVELRNLPVGLLLDLYQPAQLPWRLTVRGDGGSGSGSGSPTSPSTSAWASASSWQQAVGDAFLNGAKEADFVRRGNAAQIMGMSKADTTALWSAVRDNDRAAFSRLNARLLDAPVPLKHVPLRIYIPSSPPPSASSAPAAAAAAAAAAGSFRVMQTLVAPRMSNRHPQTVGSALRSLLPQLFPSSRDPVLANVVMHGAPVPFDAPLEELMREAAYPDGWLCLIVVLL